MVVAISWRQWQNLCEATGLEEKMEGLAALFGLDFRKEGDRFQARSAIGSLIEPWCASRTLEEIGERFDAHGVCWGAYQTFMQLVNEDPRCSLENPLFQEVEQPGIGRHLMPGSPLDFTASPRTRVRPAPLLGQHTDEVLASVLGLSDREIGDLHERGIVAGADL
jgi:2-methylfumaryl-CoA isomerase